MTEHWVSSFRGMRSVSRAAAPDLLAGLILSGALALAAWKLGGVPGVAVGQTLLVFSGIGLLVLLGLARGGEVRGLRPADRVTLLRAVLVAELAGLVFHGEAVSGHGWWLSACAVAVLLLDGMDGWVARRTHTASAFGARFDMELDAFFMLVLCALILELGKTGSWVLLIGLMRYGFMMLGYRLPALRGELPPSTRRKTVCVVQCVALIAALAPVIGPQLAVPMLGVALLLLSWSFVVDSLWLLRQSLPEGETK